MAAVHLILIFLSNLLYSCISEEIKASEDCKVTSTCNIICSGYYNSSWAQQIREIADLNNCTTIINLEISGTNFPSRMLPSNWFEENKDAIEVTYLKFQSCDFEGIESGALNIKGLKTLHFSKVVNTYFQKSFFDHLPELLTFNLDNFVESVSAEECLFDNIPKVETLSIEECILEGQMIRNITGLNGCSTKLQNIALQYNTMHYLPGHMVKNAKVLVSFYLQSNRLRNISKEAFWSVPIQKIDLRNNELTTLENGTFQFIGNTQWANSTLVLNNNEWKCDCHLKWLQDLFLDPKKVIIDPEPRCDDGQLFSEAAFECEDTTISSTQTTDAGSSETTLSSTITTSSSSTSSSSTKTTEDTSSTTISSSSSSGGGTETTMTTEATTSTDATTVTTPSHNQNIITLDCRSNNDNSLDVSSLPTGEFLRSFLINIELGDNQLVRVDIYALDINPQLELRFTGLLIEVNLLIFEIFQANSPFCITNITNTSNTIYLTDLLRNHTYTFCLLPYKETKVSPTSCFGLQVPPDWEERAWINNSDKVIVVIGITCTLVICAIISALIAFHVIKRHPRLIDGNKDVIILKHRNKMPPPLEQNFDRPDYTEPTQISSYCRSARTHSGYMTPADPTYETINYYQRRGNQSIAGGQSNFYVQPRFRNECSGSQLDRIGEDDHVESYIFTPPTFKKVRRPHRLYY